MMTTPYFDRRLESIRRCLTPEAAERILHLQPDPLLQARSAQLAAKSAAGALSEEERAEYEVYMRTGNLIAILEAKARVLLAAS